jgi:hypothetical protein
MAKPDGTFRLKLSNFNRGCGCATTADYQIGGGGRGQTVVRRTQERSRAAAHSFSETSAAEHHDVRLNSAGSVDVV